MPETDVQTRRRQPLLWWGLAFAALVLGYADLARGGETLAASLLVLGYVVLIPLAILRGLRATSDRGAAMTRRPPGE